MNVADPLPHDRIPTRILYVITKANWGGAQRYVHDLAVASFEKGLEVTVACGVEGEMSARLMSKGIPVIFVSGLGRDVAPVADVRSLLHLMQLMQALRPQIVHANSSKAGVLATLAARLSKVPHIIFTAHGWSYNEMRPWWQKTIFAVFHLVTVWCSHAVIAVSEALVQQASWMPFSKRKFVVIHNGVVPVTLVARDVARAKLAPRMAPSLLSGLWIGTLAELHPTKGLDVALLAFAQISQQFPDTVLVLVGEGQDRNYLVTLAHQLKIFNRVYFCGHVNQASTLLSAFDIFLFPSRSEGLGYVALEAGCARLPVIASNVGGIPEIIENDVTGILVNPNDAHGFAIALTSLIENPERRKKLGDALHDSVLTNFSQDQMLEKTLVLYSSN